MANYTATADKLLLEIKHLERIIDENPELALVVAKNVRRQSTLLVRELARHRDNSYSPEGTSE